jgi:hypothetical protein
MRLTKQRILLIAAALVVLSGVLVQSFNTLAGQHRTQVQQELHKVLGKGVTYERLTVSLWRGLGFAAEGFRIADNPRFAATPLVYARELVLGVSWWNLLLGRIVIDSMTFNDPEFQIITEEQGALNLAELASRKNDIGELPRIAAPAPNAAPVSFTINSLRVRNGRIDYIDRSVKEPAELQIKNVEMKIAGFHPDRPSRFTLTAALTEALERDVRIEGSVGPVVNGRPWLQQPVDLSLEFDSLYVPLLRRAIAFLRNKIPRELDVTGPMALHARVTGALGKPRISDVTLNVPLFGSSEYNAVLTAAIDLSQSDSWSQAQIQGKLSLDGIDLKQLRKLDFLKVNLPAGFAGEGAINIYSRFEGSWENLRLGAFIRADQSELHFTDWLRKPAGARAQLEARISRRNNALVLHESRLRLGDTDVTLTGQIADLTAPRLQVRFYSVKSRVAAWTSSLSPFELHGKGGEAAWDIVASKNMASPEEPWTVNGRLTMTGGKFHHQSSGRTIEDVNAEVAFLGREVRLDHATFRWGSSRIALIGHASDPGFLPLTYRLRAAELNLLDLSRELALPPGRLHNVSVEGSVESHNGATVMTGSFFSSEGTLRELPYRNLRANVSWSAGGLAYNNLSLQTLDGTFYSEGSFAGADHGFDIASRLQSADVKAVVAHMIPQLKDRLEGRIDFRGQFSAGAKGNGAKRLQSLKGSGDALIDRGAIKNFNILMHLFSRAGGVSSDSNTAASLPVALSEPAKRSDTPFDTLKARFVVEQQRLHAENFLLSTPDYTVSGTGSIGFDRTVKWNGSLTLSPRLTQELQREYTTLRYLVDRRGRLSFSFRINGKLPNVKIRHENRALAQILRLTAAQRAKTPGPDGKIQAQGQ